MPHTKEELQRMGIEPRVLQHSQHRRAQWSDYNGVGLYMVTLCVEERLPVFGNLEGSMRAPRGSADFPHLAPSALGCLVVEEELPKLLRFYPQVEIWKVALMPDHIHLLLYIRKPLPEGKHLGHLIGAFKGGCSRAWWKLTEPVANATGTPASVPASAVVPAASAAGCSAAGSSAAGPPSRRPLFESGYHDRIIKRPGMLETIKHYMADNPLRAIMRRELPRLLERRLHLRIGIHEYAAFGCLFLLKRAEKERVFYHRRDRKTGMPTENTAAFHESHARQLSEAREGVVLVSASISIPEKTVINDAIGEGLPVIHLQKEPIGQYWKPERRRFEACCRGSLLILSPWGLDEEIASLNASAAASPVSDYARFHRLNDLAAEICATTDVTLLDISSLR